jgi:hypothetical protein
MITRERLALAFGADWYDIIEAREARPERDFESHYLLIPLDEDIARAERGR